MFTRRLSADIFEPGRPAGLWSSGSRPPTHSIRTAARTWLMNHPVDTEFLGPTWRSTIDAIFRYIFTIYKLPLPKAARAWDSLQYDNWRAPLFQCQVGTSLHLPHLVWNSNSEKCRQELSQIPHPHFMSPWRLLSSGIWGHFGIFFNLSCIK